MNEFPRTKTRNKFHINIVGKHLLSWYSPHGHPTSILYVDFFFICEDTLIPLVYSAPTKNEGTLDQRIFYACRTFGNRPRDL
jgi:hypothetical protein